MTHHPEAYGALLLYGIPAVAATAFWATVAWYFAGRRSQG
jgi:hypothetical protein